MQHTRQQIIEYLQANRIATPSELSNVLLVTPANIRHHLRLLKNAGFVEVIGQEPAHGRGRPTKIFSLSENARKQNIVGLISALLKTLSKTSTYPKAIMAQTASQLLGDFPATASVYAQLNQTVEKLNLLKYQASWEASPDGPRIIFRNCPYAVIISDHPELCQLDIALVSQMLNQSVEQCAKLERDPRGSPHCAFITVARGGVEEGLSKDSV